MMRCATGTEKPTQPRKLAGCCASAARIALSYSASPLPSITNCAAQNLIKALDKHPQPLYTRQPTLAFSGLPHSYLPEL